MQTAIVGLAGAGKTTVFNTLTRGHAETGGFGGMQLNVGVVKLVLNEQLPFSTPDKGLTVNAVHATVNTIGLAKVDLIVASSKSDIGNCP